MRDMQSSNTGKASQSEEILSDVAANLFRGIEAVGGRLKITGGRLLFEPHSLNVQRDPAEILLSDIVEIRKCRTVRIIPNGLLIRTKAGEEYQFVVWGRGKLIDTIRSRMPKAVDHSSS